MLRIKVNYPKSSFSRLLIIYWGKWKLSDNEISEGELVQVLKEAKDSPLVKKYVEVMRTYREFKELRRILGKPVVTEIDPKKIQEDLSGADFVLKIEEEKKARRGKKGGT